MKWFLPLSENLLRSALLSFILVLQSAVSFAQDTDPFSYNANISIDIFIYDEIY